MAVIGLDQAKAIFWEKMSSKQRNLIARIANFDQTETLAANATRMGYTIKNAQKELGGMCRRWGLNYVQNPHVQWQLTPEQRTKKVSQIRKIAELIEGGMSIQAATKQVKAQS